MKITMYALVNNNKWLNITIVALNTFSMEVAILIIVYILTAICNFCHA